VDARALPLEGRDTALLRASRVETLAAAGLAGVRAGAGDSGRGAIRSVCQQPIELDRSRDC
jgi:hypothetical protein